jgi:Flp pilus assembly protein TadG
VSAKQTIARFAGDRSGTTAIEFAIVSPFLFMLLIGILLFGWAMHSIHSMRLALEEAGRALQLNQTLTDAQLAAMIQDRLKGMSDPNVSLIVTDDVSVPDVIAKQLSATYVFDARFPFFPEQGISYNITLSVPLRPVEFGEP